MADICWRWFLCVAWRKGGDHGRQVARGGQRRAARGFGGTEPIARPYRGGSGAGRPAQVVELDRRLHGRSVRGARGHGAAWAKRLCAGRSRGAQDMPSAGAGPRQGRHGAGRGRTDLPSRWRTGRTGRWCACRARPTGAAAPSPGGTPSRSCLCSTTGPSAPARQAVPPWPGGRTGWPWRGCQSMRPSSTPLSAAGAT